MARKKWSELAESTKKKYRRNNISPQQYNSPKFRRENAEALRNAARGRAPKSYAVQRAESFGLNMMVRDFDKLSTKVQRQLADAYMQGPMKVNAPIRATGHGGFEFAPRDNDPASHHFGETRAFDDTVMNRFRLFELFDEIGKGDMSEEDWRVYRALYNNHF
jgi:hypothetical protein